MSERYLPARRDPTGRRCLALPQQSGGLHRVGGNQIYVSPGVGIERGDAPQVRLFNRRAVAVLTLV